MKDKLQKLLDNKTDTAIVELRWLEDYLNWTGNEGLEDKLDITALKKGIDPRYILITNKKAKHDFYNAVIEVENKIAGRQLSSVFDGVVCKVIEDDLDKALERVSEQKCDGVLIRQLTLGRRKKIKGLKYEHFGTELMVPPSGSGIIAFVKKKENEGGCAEKSDEEAVLRLGMEREIIKRTGIDFENICVYARLHKGEVKISAFVDINGGRRVSQEGSIQHKERIVSAIVEKIDSIVIKYDSV